MLSMLFRLPAIAYFAIAPLGVVMAVTLYFQDRAEEAEKAAARAGKPPALVKIEEFQKGRNVGPAHEVNVLGQVDVTRMVELTRTKRGVESDRWVMAPVYPTNATSNAEPAIGQMIQRGHVSDAALQKLIAAEGAFGPIMVLDGQMVEPSNERKALDEIADKIQLAPTALLVDPFEEGRTAGLAPSTSGRDTAIFALILALLVAGYGAFRFFSERNRDRLDDPEGGYI
ncbi:hypothetical protein ACFQ1E_10955 [Sphingomonas canadensis]|uniref:SURF1-like protein n=1 Tax=Sphingomonas canadensis TaxID=1219257 RepID=A0ABW3H6R9_9SPHN|nr:hypothetical protein [Sphingomonas canadensis]MCW3836362.1 hypothetical protein [Sphingomonas canadensis]